MKKFYITTAIDYVNSLPHLGTSYEKIGADVIARFRKMEGQDVLFQMGNDEHSLNVKKAADTKKMPPGDYCNEMKKEFTKIWKVLDVDYDGFIQTSEKRHRLAVGKLFEAILKKGDIYKKPYEGWYCESCEAFFTDKDLKDGKCPNHKSKPKWVEEENYFFKLSSYQDKLLKLYKDHPEFILPEIRRNEILRLVEGGLQDVSVSRASVDWGIPLPTDPSHVVYVWFDALINYITAVGYGQKDQAKTFKKWWPADLHVIGKDITRFHCVIWPAMLMSAGVPLPKTIFGHGFVYLKGEKMSKTLGNIVTPLDIVPKYGADALRYYLLRGSSFGSDGNFTWDDFIKRYNGDLANDLGNLLNRTLGMTNKYLKGKINPTKEPNKLLVDATTKALKTLRESMDYEKGGDVDFHSALESIWEIIHVGDKYIDERAPWVLDKGGKKKEVEQVLYHVADTLRNISILIAPFMPETSKKVWEQLGLTEWKNQSFKNVGWGKTPSIKVTQGKPIFPRIDVKTPAAFTKDKRGTTKKKEKKMDLLDFKEFQKIDLRIAEIKEAEKVEGADRLLKLQVDLGGETRQIVAGIAEHYKPEELVGKRVTIVANLKPAKIRGVESNGMLLAASNEEGLSVVSLDRPLAPGAKVR